MASHNFEVGDLVWAKMKGFPPWPGKVSKPPENKKINDKKPRCYIFFFGSENYAFVACDNVWPYLEKRDEYITLPRPSHSFQEAVDAIDDYIREHGGNVPESKAKADSSSPGLSPKKKDEEDKESVDDTSRRTRKRQSSVSLTPQKTKSKTDAKIKEVPKQAKKEEEGGSKEELPEENEDEGVKPSKAMKLSEIDVEVRSKKISRKKKDEDDDDEEDDSLIGDDVNVREIETPLKLDVVGNKSEDTSANQDQQQLVPNDEYKELNKPDVSVADAPHVDVKNKDNEKIEDEVDNNVLLTEGVVEKSDKLIEELEGEKVIEAEHSTKNTNKEELSTDTKLSDDKEVKKKEDSKDKDKSTKDKELKDKVTKDKEHKDKGSKDKEHKDKSTKEKEVKDKGTKEKSLKDKEAKDKVSSEKASKDKDSSDKGAKKSEKMKQQTKSSNSASALPPDSSNNTTTNNSSKKAYLPDVVGPQPATALTGSTAASNKQAAIVATNKRIGFLGCGSVGEGLIGCLLASGHKVTVWNRTMAKCKEVLKKGASKGSSPSEVVKSCDIVFACLSDANALKDVVFGNHGALQTMGDNKGFINLSTVDVETTMDVSEAITSIGGRFLEAPLMGSIESSRSGHMIVLASGDQSLFEDCQSCFKSIANNVFNLADITTASKMQIVLNSLYGTTLAGLAESMALACKVGLDPSEVLDVISHTTVNSALIREKGKAMAKNNLMEASFRLDTLQKDIRLAINMSEEVDQPLHVGSVVNELFKRAKAKGYGEADVAAVYRAADL